MKEELYQEYRNAIEQGNRQEASEKVRVFISSFDVNSDRKGWVRQFLESADHGHKIRHELFREIVFPELLKGYQCRDAWSLYYLAQTTRNLRDAYDLWAQIDQRSEDSLLELCHEADPGFRDVGRELLDRVRRKLSFATHEWPAGLCLEIEEIEKLLKQGRKLDRESRHTGFFDEVARDVAEARQHFHVVPHQFFSDALHTSRRVGVHGSIHRAPNACLIFLDGELYTERVHAVEIIHAAQANQRLRPITCVYLPNANAAGRHADYTCNEAFATFVAEELPRWIEREVGRFERLFLCGLSLSALQAVFTALRHPGVFAGVLAQSPSAWWQEEWLAANIPAQPSRKQHFWLSVGTQELQTNVSHPPTPLVQTTSQLDSVRRLGTALTAAGHDIHLHEYDGGHDPACWAEELREALAWLMKR